MLSAALIVAAVFAGLAGSWSPCGLSMVETLAPGACGGRRSTSAGGALAFAAGALGGGVVTFGGLALLGDRLGAGGGAAAAVAVAALLVAALGDAAGRRIVPQVRRQVPESWRRIVPVPVAAGLYGILLGLGFTTFLLSFATWALAAACLAIGTPATGVAVGLAFGAGRALPVAVLAPISGGAAALGARPNLLRGLRAVAAAGLVAAAVALIAAPPAARAVTRVATDAADPSVSGGLLAYQPSEGPGVLVRRGRTEALPGTHPAVSEGLVAWLADRQIVIADAATLTPVRSVAARDVDALALSDSHVAWLAGDTIRALDLTDPAAAAQTAGRAPRRGSIGRPSLDGSRLVFASSAPSGSRILQRNLHSGQRTVLRRSRLGLLLAPTKSDGRLLYVKSTYERQKLMLGRRTLYSTTPTGRRDKGYEDSHGRHPHHEGYPDGKRPKLPPRPAPGEIVTLFNTALSGDSAYYTWLRARRSGHPDSRIYRVGL